MELVVVVVWLLFSLPLCLHLTELFDVGPAFTGSSTTLSMTSMDTTVWAVVAEGFKFVSP